MKHVHHDMIVEWAKDTSRVVEVRGKGTDEWLISHDPVWKDYLLYRFKPAEPKYIVVNGIQVPEPVREPLKNDQNYWVADPSAYDIYGGWWASKALEIQCLSRGLIHLTREAAQTHIDAMLLPSRTDK